MIWPFRRFNSDSAGRRTAGEKPGEQGSSRTWRLLQVESSLACNLACIMCPWRGEDGRSDGSGLMDERVWAAVRSNLKEAETVDFTGGGEPLLRPDLKKWIKAAADSGCRAGFLTNGTLLTEDVAREMVDAGLDWIGISLDGATAEVYESVRPGANFRRVCGSIARLAGLKQDGRPRIFVNVVMMTVNAHQLAELVRLAAELGADRITFKQCDVLRAVNSESFELFDRFREKRIRVLEKALGKARRLAGKLGLETTEFSFFPDEQPVCAQDPLRSLFIARDGSVAPCIGAAYGGPGRFFGQAVVIPTTIFGRLPEQDLSAIWRSERCRAFRDRFRQRHAAYASVLGRSQFEASLIKLEETFQAAREAMPPAPECCRVCHYLFGV